MGLFTRCTNSLLQKHLSREGSQFLEKIRKDKTASNSTSLVCALPLTKLALITPYFQQYQQSSLLIIGSTITDRSKI